MSTEWRELYDREYPRLLRALVACGGDLDAAEDAAQEAFVRAHREGPEWSTRVARPGAWLLVVATRELFRDRRTRRRTEGWPDLDRPAPGSAYDAAIDRADLIAALRQLAPRQRAVVVARFYYGLSYNEIASAFAMTSGTVGATLHQALAKLRQIHLAGRLARGAMQ